MVARPVVEVTTSDVLDFVTAQRAPRRGNVVRIADGESGMAASTIKRRLTSAAGLFSYLVARGLVQANPVPRGLAPAEVTALLDALRTRRDRALVLVMVLGALRLRSSSDLAPTWGRADCTVGMLLWLSSGHGG